jgi:hypothetical protein
MRVGFPLRHKRIFGGGWMRHLIRDWFGIGLSLVTIGKYLRSWGLSPQKPIRRAYEQDSAAVARWLAERYPAIEAQARKEKAIRCTAASPSGTGFSSHPVMKGGHIRLWFVASKLVDHTWQNKTRFPCSESGCARCGRTPTHVIMIPWPTAGPGIPATPAHPTALPTKNNVDNPTIEGTLRRRRRDRPPCATAHARWLHSAIENPGQSKRTPVVSGESGCRCVPFLRLAVVVPD